MRYFRSLMQLGLDYRASLKGEFLGKAKKNPHYSLRAFSRDTGLSPSFLSQVFNGHRNLTEKKGEAIGRSLKWGATKTEIFCRLIRWEASAPEIRVEIAKDISRLSRRLKSVSFHNLDLDAIELVSNWYYPAILEAVKLRDFQPSTAWIAKRFGIGKFEAEKAVAILLRLGLVEKKGDQLTLPHQSRLLPPTPSAAVRAFHRQHLELAAKAIHTQPFETRDFMGVTMAISKNRIAEAKALIDKFKDEMLCLTQDEPADSVYHFATQLYRLDQGDNP